MIVMTRAANRTPPHSPVITATSGKSLDAGDPVGVEVDVEINVGSCTTGYGDIDTKPLSRRRNAIAFSLRSPLD